jgi:3-hydroxyisobutyrate dehydrogenase-like beta-hydroxyacid dehydrogenase
MTDGLFRGSDVYATFGAAMLDGMPAGRNDATVADAVRTLDLISRAADRAHVPMPAVDACRDRLLGSIAHGHGSQHWTALYHEQLRASGLE